MVLDYSIIGERLKKARKNNKLTQEQLAEKLDVSVAFLSRVERGDVKVNLGRLNQICDILGVSLVYALTGNESNSKNYLSDEFSNLLKNCSPEQTKLIYGIAKVIINQNDKTSA